MTDVTRTSKELSSRKPSDQLTDDDYLTRLKSKCIVTEFGCWEKQGFRSLSKGMEQHGPSRGYGHMYYRGRRWASHRLSWLLTRGLIPAGSVVMHKCDNPPCCNPDHLELGTDKQNMQEAGKRKRWPRQYRETCINGHPRTPENVIYHGREKKMRCQVCQLIKWRKAAGWPQHMWTIPKVPNGYSHEQVTRNAT
jgi:hypothetical protein